MWERSTTWCSRRHVEAINAADTLFEEELAMTIAEHKLVKIADEGMGTGAEGAPAPAALRQQRNHRAALRGSMSKETASISSRVLVLEAGRSARHYWRDLWDYRELFAILAWRDLAVRYKQTVIGVAWAVIRPLMTMVIFTIVFGRLAKLPSEGNAPYAIMVYSGMLPWFLFSSILGDASNSIVGNSSLIGKVYFPRIIIPAAAGVVSLVDFGINFALMFALMAWYGFAPGWRIIFLPAFVILAVLAALGPALVITALNVKYRDFRYITPFLMQFGLYVSPVGFATTVVPSEWRFWYSLNPLVGVIDGFRWCLLGGNSVLYVPGLTLGIAVTAILFWLGITYFRRNEKNFADLV
jgi:lipopolysaccharide transport system permease protein